MCDFQILMKLIKKIINNFAIIIKNTKKKGKKNKIRKILGLKFF